MFSNREANVVNTLEPANHASAVEQEAISTIICTTSCRWVWGSNIRWTELHIFKPAYATSAHHRSTTFTSFTHVYELRSSFQQVGIDALTVSKWCCKSSLVPMHSMQSMQATLPTLTAASGCVSVLLLLLPPVTPWRDTSSCCCCSEQPVRSDDVVSAASPLVREAYSWRRLCWAESSWISLEPAVRVEHYSQPYSEHRARNILFNWFVLYSHWYSLHSLYYFSRNKCNKNEQLKTKQTIISHL